MSTNEKKKPRFNVIDAIVILAIVFAVAIGVYAIFISGGVGAGSGTYTVKYFCEEVPDFAAEVIQVGDKVVDEQKDVDLGTVTDVVVAGSRTYTTTATGEIKMAEKPHYNSVELTTTLKGQDYDNGVIAGSSKYGVGHSITIRVGKAKIFGRVSAIEKVE